MYIYIYVLRSCSTQFTSECSDATYVDSHGSTPSFTSNLGPHQGGRAIHIYIYVYIHVVNINIYYKICKHILYIYIYTKTTDRKLWSMRKEGVRNLLVFVFIHCHIKTNNLKKKTSISLHISIIYKNILVGTYELSVPR